ncbi:MAG: enoyl-CoA hydratase/isomerase family protein [Stappiaceae bacterium]
MSEAEEDILFDVVGKAGVVTLNRPKALNALTHDMIRRLRSALDTWRDAEEVKSVIVRTHEDAKAFCSGGDIRHACSAGQSDDPRLLEFFADEYRLNSVIKHYPKPYVSLIDGIVMGGGVGISVHGSHRIGGEKLLFSMPEVSIGFFPDVGGTYFLPRLPHKVGIYCAVTGGRMKLEDAVWSGVITHPVPSERFDDVFSALTQTDDPDTVLNEFTFEPGHAPLADHAHFIEAVFARETVAAIRQGLAEAAGADQDWAKKTLSFLERGSPTSVEIALRQMQRGATLDFVDCMRLEFRIVSQILKGHDFYEGVRAVLIDRDNAPKWKPDGHDLVTSLAIENHFIAPPGGDLVLD